MNLLYNVLDKVSVFINAIKVLVNTAYSTSQLNECNVAKMNGLLPVEFKGNAILDFLWSNVIMLFMFLFIILFYCCN